MKKTTIALMVIAILTTFNSCKKDDPAEKNIVIKNDVPEFFAESEEGLWGVNQPIITEILGSSSRISKPTDLDFNPTREGELWIVNEGVESTGGSTVRLQI